MYIDSHAHLFYDDYAQDLDDVIRRANDAGVEYIIVPGTTLETSFEAVELAHRYRGIFACVGFHPHEASKATDEQLTRIEELSGDEKVVAIGEIGLDFHYDFSPREVQARVFQEQINLAHRRELPIVVHTRESMAEAIDAVGEFGNRNETSEKHDESTPRGPGDHLSGVFHCFTGTLDQAHHLLESGFFVSYPGMVTFKNSPVRETLKHIGYEKILIETDSPYLTPAPFRGKRNEPMHVRLVAKTIAELLGVEIERVADATAKNAIQLFSLT